MSLSSASRPDATLKGASPSATPKTQTAAAPAASKEGYRETVEAIVVAFILALLVRGFEAEAFVIPTGSMAPTLMGRHKEVACPQCGHVYAVNASDEVEGYSGGTPASRRVASGVCVNCRYQAKILDEPSFKGDRILVMKFPYDLAWLPGAGGPSRWDVVVFRYPEDPETSYIKRLVGLPGETVRVWHGDVFIKPPGGHEFGRTHRPLPHQRAMQMMVYDDAYRPRSLRDRPEWRRWVPADGASWAEEASAAPGTFTARPTGEGWAELRYRHVFPDPAQWRAIEAGEAVPGRPRETLITDFYSYNTNLNAENSDLTGETSRDQLIAWLQPHWVGDLTLSARVNVTAPGGSVRFDLVEGGLVNRCLVDLTTGEAVVTHDGAEVGRGPTNLKGTGVHDVEFANVDNRLTLLVNGRPALGEGFVYDDPGGSAPRPTAEDLAPVRVAARGNAVKVSDLVLKRDIYYTLNPGGIDFGNAWDAHVPRAPGELTALLADPARYAELGSLGPKEYPIGEDRFLMLGDNSPRSKDSRGWEAADRYVPGDDDNGLSERGWDASGRETWEVPRNMLTGKAFCIYWPHGKPFGPDVRLGPDFRVPFRPYVERMRWIR
jgi:signal peptidase I